MNIEQTRQLIQGFYDMGYLVGVAYYSSLALFAKEGFDNVNIIVEHH